jgi:hypothetical protein
MNYIYPELWSEQMVVLAKPDPKIDSPYYRFVFSMPVSDTMHVQLISTIGGAWSDNDIFLDGVKRASSIGYTAIPSWGRQSDTLDLGEHFLAQGEHTIAFRITGQDKRGSGERLLGPDFLLLTPTTFLPFEKGTIVPPVGSVVLGETPSALRIFPNPVSGDYIRIATGGGSAFEGDLTLHDMLGREIMRAHLGKIDVRIPIDVVPNGMYVAHFAGSNGKTPLRSLLRVLR